MKRELFMKKLHSVFSKVLSMKNILKTSIPVPLLTPHTPSWRLNKLLRTCLKNLLLELFPDLMRWQKLSVICQLESRLAPMPRMLTRSRELLPWLRLSRTQKLLLFILVTIFFSTELILSKELPILSSHTMTRNGKNSVKVWDPCFLRLLLELK